MIDSDKRGKDAVPQASTYKRLGDDKGEGGEADIGADSVETSHGSQPFGQERPDEVGGDTGVR